MKRGRFVWIALSALFALATLTACASGNKLDSGGRVQRNDASSASAARPATAGLLGRLQPLDVESAAAPTPEGCVEPARSVANQALQYADQEYDALGGPAEHRQYLRGYAAGYICGRLNHTNRDCAVRCAVNVIAPQV